MQDGALDHALKTERRLGVDLLVAGDGRGVLGYECRQLLAQLVDAGGARAQYLGRRWVVEQGKQQVFDGDELMTLLPRFDKSHVQTDFQFLRDHFNFPP